MAQISLNLSEKEDFNYKKEKSEIEEELNNINIDNLTPFEALNKLNELKSKIK
jgi:DNA mismatch repair ATPase MutS